MSRVSDVTTIYMRELLAAAAVADVASTKPAAAEGFLLFTYCF